MKIVIFEDSSYKQFYPLSLTRPVFSLKCGVFSFIDKIKSKFINSQCLILIRKELKPLYDKGNVIRLEEADVNEEYLFISSSILLGDNFNIELNQGIKNKGELIAFRVMGLQIRKLKEEFFFDKDKLNAITEKWNLKLISSEYKKLNYLFELVYENSKEIKKDIAFILKTNSSKEFKDLPNKELYIHDSVRVHPGVYFLTDNGPIYIDKNAEIKPLSVIEGPCYIAKNVLIDGAKIRANSSIFDGCKIAGEVSDSIILDLTNKHHDGFLGHSYIGSYVNFGAMSTNSDLKNNYGEITLTFMGECVKTGLIKVGAFIGDHSKLGIGSLINTGTVIGVGCNLYFEGGMYPKEVPSFSWGGSKPFRKYIFLDFIKNCKKVLKRRGYSLTKENIDLYALIFEQEKKKIK